MYRPQPAGEAMFYAWFMALHTRIDILFRCSAGFSEADCLQLVRAIRADLTRVEHMGNAYDADSELTRVNRTAAVRPVALSDELYRLLADCMVYNRRTQHLFDITVHTPGHSPQTIVGVHFDEHRRIFFDHPVTLNLSGILKGYALDRTLQLLRRHGMEHALLSFGTSSMAACGTRRGADGWPVGLATKPGGSQLVLRDACLTTSGTTAELGAHIVDPLTGRRPEVGRSVAVVTPSATEGEVLSTSFFLADEALRARLRAEFSVARVIDM